MDAATSLYPPASLRTFTTSQKNTQVQLINLSPNFLLCCLPGRLFILLPYLYKFLLPSPPPPRIQEKIVPWEKDNNNLWQSTWVKCPRVMKQLQALTDGPCCKLAVAAVTETAGRQMQRHNHRTRAPSLMFVQQHSGVSSHNIHFKQIFGS